LKALPRKACATILGRYLTVDTPPRKLEPHEDEFFDVYRLWIFPAIMQVVA
jgi:hypothetical protein